MFITLTLDLSGFFDHRLIVNNNNGGATAAATAANTATAIALGTWWLLSRNGCRPVKK